MKNSKYADFRSSNPKMAHLSNWDIDQIIKSTEKFETKLLITTITGKECSENLYKKWNDAEAKGKLGELLSEINYKLWLKAGTK